jgi:hypothetical protein
MVETEIVLGALEALLNRPAQPRRAGQFAQRDTNRRKGKIVGPFVGLPPTAPDQKPVLEARGSGRRQRDPRPLIRIPGEGLGLDSCAVAKRVGWCAMSRGGRPWRELLVI